MNKHYDNWLEVENTFDIDEEAIKIGVCLQVLSTLKLLQDYGISTYKAGKYRDLNEGRITFGIKRKYIVLYGTFSSKRRKTDWVGRTNNI